jgi:hypothetical protein
MTKKIFTANPYLNKNRGVFFAFLSLFFLFTTDIGFIPFYELSRYFLAFLSIIVAYIFWVLPPPEIEVDVLGIKHLYKKNQVLRFISYFIYPDVKCEWNRISSVITILTDSTYRTVLYASEAFSKKPKYRLTIESWMFKDYVSILKIIKERAPQANLDKTTSLILKGQIDIRPVRPFIWWIAIITILIGIIYEYYIKG